MAVASQADGFDRAAAVTRSMLGWGVVAGPFYLIFGLILALTRPGFALNRDALSMLLLGNLGWLQATNLVLAGLMTLVAAVGMLRTPAWPRTAAVLVAVYGVCLIMSAVFPPDATADFPPGAGGGAFTMSGMLHLVFGGIGFLSRSGGVRGRSVAGEERVGAGRAVVPDRRRRDHRRVRRGRGTGTIAVRGRPALAGGVGRVGVARTGVGRRVPRGAASGSRAALRSPVFPSLSRRAASASPGRTARR
ncbi:DUF998 domain-containing protein [Microbacterium sp. NPDC057659]|uniref:DUF998 domain-containing protein n=1 Tax=Microbacterium sp. NPDC057659 TaxID=3346198 RepID=UPI0036724AEE